MTTTGTGIFYDGITSNRREVAVEIAGDAIEVRGPGGCLKARWHFADISPLAAPAGVLRIGLANAKTTARLEIHDQALATALLDAIARIGRPLQMRALLTAPEWEALKGICTEG